MPFAAALSEHPVPAEAVGEVVGAVLDGVGPGPDLAVVVVSPALAGALEDVARAVRATLAPGTLVGAAATTVLGGAREVEAGPAVALWAGRTGRVLPVRVDTDVTDSGVRVGGIPAASAVGGPRTLLLLGDPFSLPAEGLLRTMAGDLPHVTVVGGLASAATGPGGSRLVLDDEVHHDGAVGALLPPGVAVRSFASQGCRPVGEPMIVTEAEGNLLLGLAGRPALDRLLQVGAELDDEDRALFEHGPQVGIVLDEGRATFATGDFLVRGVLGVDPERRGVTVGQRVPVGTTVQMHLRDPATASVELHRLLAEHAPGGSGAAGALVFTCNGRGTAFFGVPDHDAEAVVDHVGPAVAGLACAGEIGPLGGRSHLHTQTASVLVLGEWS